MKQIIIHLDNPDIQALEKVGEKIAVSKVTQVLVHDLICLQ